MFVAREGELARFRAFLESGQNAMLIYGMRRTGKTALIHKALESWEGKSIYYQCSQESAKVNLDALVEEYGMVFGDSNRHFETFPDFFSFLARLATPIVIVLDEYNYLKDGYGKTQTDSMMQRIIDSIQGTTLKVVLCGSEVTVMKELLDHDNPLFDRFSTTIHVRPFDYYDSSLFSKEADVRDKVLIHSIFGGLPAALKEVRLDQSIEENIKTLLLDPDGRLRILVERTLLMEYRKLGSVSSLLTLIGNGKRTYAQLRDKLDARNTGNLTKLLSKLETNESVKRIDPINKRGDDRAAFYTIGDNLLRFYFTYVHPNRGRIEMLGVDEVYRLFVKDSLDTWVSYRFEEIARSYFSRRVRKGLEKDILDIGLYWYDDRKRKTNGEFDCVLAHPDGYEVIEVKHLAGKMGEELALQEKAKIQAIEGLRLSGIGFVSLEGFDFNWPECRLVTGKDLYDDRLA